MAAVLTYLRAAFTSLLASLAHQYDCIIHSGLPLFFWVRPRFSVTDIPSQYGKVVLVTGGNSGTGYATCKALYDRGATVYMACRDGKKAREGIEAIERGGVFGVDGITYPDEGRMMNGNGNGHGNEVGKGKGRLEFLELDLADLRSVERCAEDLGRREDRLDLLFANAGVMASPEGLYTRQGYTLQFGTNCLGHQHLISLLLPILLRSSRSHPESPSRVIISSSAGHSAAPPCGVDYRSVVRDTTSLNGHSIGQANGHGNGHVEAKPVKGRFEKMKWVEYGQSKWGDVALARCLHWVYGPDEGREKRKAHIRRVGKGEIISISIHPGMVATNLAQHISLTPYVLKWIPWAVRFITRTPSIGALNQLWAATCPNATARSLSGEYVVPFQRFGRARMDLDDADRVQAVWKWCEVQAKRVS